MNGSFVIEALQRVWRALEPLNQPMAVMGGMALAVWKHVRATLDVDVLISLESADEAALTNLLGSAGIRQTAASIRLGELRLLRFACPLPDSAVELEVDVLLAGGEYHKVALRRRLQTSLGDSTVYVLTCEDLILHKLLAGRIIDRYDVAELLRQNHAQLDTAYLASWAATMGVSSQLEEVWRSTLGKTIPNSQERNGGEYDAGKWKGE